MKKSLSVLVCLLLILSLGVVSAFSFSDFWKKITGGVTEDSDLYCAGEGEAPIYSIEGPSKPCCEGLKAIAPKAIEIGGLSSVSSVSISNPGVCWPCGDGICNSSYEDEYNCPKDCEYINCIDSDVTLEYPYGKNYYEKGSILWNGVTYEDECGVNNSNFLKEWVCEEDSEGNLDAAYVVYNCVNGCQDGACIVGVGLDQSGVGVSVDVVGGVGNCGDGICNSSYEDEYNCPEDCANITCTDSDGGKNYSVKGTVIVGNLSGTDECTNQENLWEYYCDGNELKGIDYDCSEEGKICLDGACLTPTYIEPEEDEEPLEIPEDTEEIIYVCNGCELDNKCIPYGFRTQTKVKDKETLIEIKINLYCDLSGEFIKQKKAEEDCENNYECESNICSSGECIELQKMLNEAGRFKSLGIRIMCRLAHIFNEDNYKTCIGNFLGEDESNKGGGGGSSSDKDNEESS